jgi:hypothetical protein
MDVVALPVCDRLTLIMSVLKFLSHGGLSLQLATRAGWLPAARYTDLRKVRRYPRLGLLDICWRRYSFDRHFAAVKQTRPLMTVARDIQSADEVELTLREAEFLARYAAFIIIVPKDPHLAERLENIIPAHYILGYSVPTRYGATCIPPEVFTRPVHLLGGRPDVQRRLAEIMKVVSFDCNRFTLDARFGDYFDGNTFRPHPIGGLQACLQDSIENINHLWHDYTDTISPALRTRHALWSKGSSCVTS